MIHCPHCRKPIEEGLSPIAIKRATELRKLGITLRGIALTLFVEGLAHSGSLSSLSRHFRKKRKK